MGAKADTAMAAATHCRNCDFRFTDDRCAYCSNCGQATALHPPTFFEFFHEFITHYVALEGKLWKTLWLLFFKPAELTREYRQGRKQRYISPLRLYITASFLFFLVIKIAGVGSAITFDTPDEEARMNTPMFVSNVKTDAATKSRASTVKAEKDSSSGSNAAKDKSGEDADDKTVDDMVKGIVSDAAKNAKQSAIESAKNSNAKNSSAKDDDSIDVADFNCAAGAMLCPWLKSHLKQKYNGKTQIQVLGMLKDGTIANIPYALFMLLPLFALLTKLLYVNRGYYYGEHVVYALHIHAFTFFVLLLFALMPGWLGAVVSIAAAVYYLVALQRFFGGRWPMTFIRYTVIGVVYPILLVLVASFFLLFIAII